MSAVPGGSASSAETESEEKRRTRRAVVVARVEEFPPGARREVKVGPTTIAIFNIGGAYHAIYGLCPHQFAPLSRGKLQGTVLCNAETDWKTEWVCDGEVVVCPGHAMEFHVRTGQAFGYNFSLRTYQVTVEDGMVILHV